MIGKIAVVAGMICIHATGATPVAAQVADRSTEVGPAAPTAVSAAERLRPTMASATLIPGISFAAADVDELERSVLYQRRSSGIPLMAAGAVLFFAGAIIGDDAGTVLMLGGAGVAAYGVYLYFR